MPFSFSFYLFKNNEDKSCIICWMNNQPNDPIQLLSDCYYIQTTCKCNPHIHFSCLNEWASRHMSCPICRTKLHINETNKFISYYSYFEYFINCLFNIIQYTILIFYCIIFYNVISVS